MAVKGNMQAKVPMLSGNPSQQAMKGAMQARGMPKMSPGKPAKSIVGKPASTPVNKATKQPGKSGKQAVRKGTVGGIRKGKISAADMGIG